MEYVVSVIISSIFKLYNNIIYYISAFRNEESLLLTDNNTTIRIRTNNKLNELSAKFYLERYFDSRDISSITMEKHYNKDSGLLNSDEITSMKLIGNSYYITFNPRIRNRTKNFINQFNTKSNIIFTDLFSKEIFMDKHSDSSSRLFNAL